MDRTYIKSLHWTSTITYDAGTIIPYNLSIGANGQDLSRCWESHPNFHALPTFASIPVINIMGKITRDMPSFLPNFDPIKHAHVHGEHYLEVKQAFPSQIPTTLISEARVVDVLDRRSGVAVVIGIVTRDATSDVELCYSEWTSFLIGMDGTGASKVPKLQPQPQTQSHSRSRLESAPPQSQGKRMPTMTREPDAIVAHQTTPEQGALYRAATGEWNPMHIDPEHGRRAGFPGPILSGTCTIGVGVRHVIDTFAGGDSGRFVSVKLRLSKPVFPGEVIKTVMWRGGDSEEGKKAEKKDEGVQEIVYQQRALDGRVVISEAVVRLRGKEGGKYNGVNSKI